MRIPVREVKVSKPQTIMEDAMGFELQTISVGVDNRSYYNAYVACKQLGYANVTQTLESVPSYYIKRFNELKAGGGTLIPWLDRRGLQWLVLGCRKKSAEPFKKWVVEEVLESIYTNGGYIMGQEKLSEDERNKLLSRIHNLEQEVSNARKALGMTGENKKRDAKELRALSMQFRDRADKLDEEGDNILANMNEMPNGDNVFNKK